VMGRRLIDFELYKDECRRMGYEVSRDGRPGSIA